MKSCALMSVFLVAAALTLVALGWLLIQASPATEGQRQADLLYRQQRDAQDLQERAERAQLNRRLYDAWIPAAQAAGVGVILAVPVAAGLAGWAFLRHRARHHGEFVHVGDGIPLPRARLLAGLFDDTIHADTLGRRAAEIERARNPVHQLPQGLRTYAPKYGNTAAPRSVGSAPDPAQALAAPSTTARDKLPAPMTASLLLRAGYTPTADKLLLGMGNGYPVWTPAASHTAIAGPTGSGKDVTSRLLLTQIVAAVPNARAVILDPHHVWCDPADGCDLTPLQAAGVQAVTEKRDIAGYLEWLARGELQERIRARRAGQPMGRPTWVLVNEAPAVLADYPDTAKHIRAAVNEGRKFGLYLIVASQDFLAATLKESSIRSQLGTAINLGADPFTARALGVVPPPDAGVLGKGVGYVRAGQDAPQLARLPMFDADAARLLLPAPPTGPRNDSASWAAAATYPTGGEPLRAYTPTDAPPGGGMGGRPPTPAVPPETTAKAPAEPPIPPTPPTPPTPPPTLAERAAAAAIPLDDEEAELVKHMDAGKTPAAAAAALAGQYKGGRYERLRRKAQDAQQLIENWPDGEQWAGDA